MLSGDAKKALEGVLVAMMPPNVLDNTLPDGSLFTHRSLANLGGRVLYLTAKGTRDPVRHVHFEDQQTPANRGKVLEALHQGEVEAVGRHGPGH